MRHDWYRKEYWQGNDKEEFFKRLGRSRGSDHKAQYLRIQAYSLYSSGKKEMVEEAIYLLNLILADYPDDFRKGSVNRQLGDCWEFLGDVESALKFYRTAVEEESKSNVGFQGANVFAIFAIKHKLVSVYDEALSYLSRENPIHYLFPIDRYDHYATFSIIQREKGNLSEARQSAGYAIAEYEKTHSGLTYHKKLGLVNVKDPFLGELVEILKN